MAVMNFFDWTSHDSSRIVFSSCLQRSRRMCELRFAGSEPFPHNLHEHASADLHASVLDSLGGLSRATRAVHGSRFCFLLPVRITRLAPCVRDAATQPPCYSPTSDTVPRAYRGRSRRSSEGARTA